MRTLTASLIVFASLLTARAQAKCSMDFVVVLPLSEVRLPTNPRIVAEGYGSDRRVIEDLAAGKRDPRLVAADGESIPLRVVESFVATLSNEVELAPEHELRPATRYAVLIAGHHYGWKTAEAPDRVAPTWTGSPTVLYRSDGGRDSGPSLWFQLPVADDRPGLMVIADVVAADPAANPTRQRFIVGVDHGETALHYFAGCEAVFELKPQATYRASFTAIDLSGNEAPAPAPVDVTLKSIKHRR